MIRYFPILFLFALNCVAGPLALLSWSSNLGSDYTVWKSTNAGASFIAVSNGNFNFYLVDCTNQQPSPVWVSNIFFPNGVWSNDCTPYNQFKVSVNISTNPLTLLADGVIMTPQCLYWPGRAAYDAAHNFRVKIQRFP